MSLDKYTLKTVVNGSVVISDTAPRAHVRIGGYVAEDGTLLVTAGDLVLGRLPDLAGALSEIQQRLAVA
ncbi:hypothetical protein [Pseudogemmobacter faecipullorum]|uniref:Uncharacterized protein n=1 Tax=Pseudogemmobacter faecipullorum TaxID=2755041 RepID=A0ABS8CTE2_9RHOB|nr:hypothetical protein [Pseudogemmobacter faecipullorum]MCB5412425.1 hypothetical protein [Pseudogemmobacter faecipullorum]